MATPTKHKKPTKKSKHGALRERHLLYTAAVQSVDADCDFFQRIYKAKRKEKPRRLREDFCGTAVLAYEWVSRHKHNEAIGVDLDQATLDWGVQHYRPHVKGAAERVQLICNDVREISNPKVDVVAAQNFSYSVFKTRAELRAYFQGVRRSLRNGGVFFLDALGGTEAMEELVEKRKIPASKAFHGTKIPGFTYVWEQAKFNPVNHDLKCHIHFKLRDGTRIKRAFSYDWRLWTLPELQELLLEAGFAETEVYLEGWDEDEDDTDGIFRRRKHFENQSAWVAYVVGIC